MLHMPYDASPLGTVVGIDPGTVNMGVASITFDFRTFEIVNTQAYTLYGPLMLGNPMLIEQNGERYERIQAIEERLFEFFCNRYPYAIYCESAYINRRRPQAYGALVQAICAVRSALYRYDPWMGLNMVEPSVAKKALAGTGVANKDQIKDAMLAQANALHLQNDIGSINAVDMDEHSNDAGAICFSGFSMIKNARTLNQTVVHRTV